jgi:hypothetical protein
VRLTRVVHAGNTRVVFGSPAELLPDVAPSPGVDAAELDACLLFVDDDGSEAHAYLFPSGQLRELAERILAPQVEVVRTFPGGMLGPNGDGA